MGNPTLLQIHVQISKLEVFQLELALTTTVVPEEGTSSQLRKHIKEENIKLPRGLLNRSFLRIWANALMPYWCIGLSLTLARWATIEFVFQLPVHFLLFLAAHRAFQTLIHDLSHKLFSAGERRNDFFGNLFAAGWVGLTVEAYRAIHLKHHRYNGSALDPEYIDFDIVRARGGLAGFFLRYMFGLEALRLVRKYYFPERDIIVAKSTDSEKETFIQRSKHKAYIVVAQVSMLFLCVFVAKTWYLYLFWVYLAMSWSPMLSALRFLVEHPGRSDRTVSTISWFFELRYFAPYHFNYHMEHHLWPSVPPYQLKKTHGFLRQQGYYDRHPECLNDTYVGSLRRRQIADD